MAGPFDLACRGYGESPARLMFVGISAGRRGALVTSVPFTKDASGRLFQRCLGRLGLSGSGESSVRPDLSGCYVTNLVKGRCLTRKGLNRLPTRREVRFWWDHFLRELDRVQPRTVVAVGDFVWIYLRSRHKYVEDRGIRLVKVKHPRWYCSNGALKSGSKMFEQMVLDYREAFVPELERQ